MFSWLVAWLFVSFICLSVGSLVICSLADKHRSQFLSFPAVQQHTDCFHYPHACKQQSVFLGDAFLILNGSLPKQRPIQDLNAPGNYAVSTDKVLRTFRKRKLPELNFYQHRYQTLKSPHSFQKKIYIHTFYQSCFITAHSWIETNG
jgi:hypothetical protein